MCNVRQVFIMPPPQVSIEDGIRQGTHFIHGPDGYSYHFNREMKGGRLSLECLSYRSTCRGRASVNGEGREFRQTQRHNHAPDWCLLHERRFRSAVLSRCRNGDTETLRTIYDQERTRLRIPRLAAANIPFPTLRPSMQNARDKSLPPLPHSLSELDFLLNLPKYKFLTKSLDGQDSIYAGAAGSTQHGTRCLIFISRRMLRILQKVEDLFADATFCVVPRNMGCAQVWNIVTMKQNHVIGIGSVLMQTRTTECYRAAIGALKHLIPGLRPKSIMWDYEAAQQKAFALEFPNAERHGCLFHASKAILQHAREMGLVPLIKEDEVCDTAVRSMCALPLLPTDKIVPGVMSLAEHVDSMGRWDALAPFFDYIRRTWLSPSKLPILSVANCEVRTSNGCESLNHTMQTAVGQLAHPNVFYLISGFVRLEDRYFQDLYTLKRGGKIGRNRKLSAVTNDERIKGLSRELESNGISVRSFLRRASRRMQNVYNDVLGLIEKCDCRQCQDE